MLCCIYLRSKPKIWAKSGAGKGTDKNSFVSTDPAMPGSFRSFQIGIHNNESNKDVNVALL
jgi:hypothetical protein